MNYPRIEYEMSQADCDRLLSAMKPVPYMIIGGVEPRSQQDNANAAWSELGNKMGFDYNTVQPVAGKGMLFFTAVPTETPEARAERETIEREVKRKLDISNHEKAIREHQESIDKLKA